MHTGYVHTVFLKITSSNHYKKKEWINKIVVNNWELVCLTHIKTHSSILHYI